MFGFKKQLQEIKDNNDKLFAEAKSYQKAIQSLAGWAAKVDMTNAQRAELIQIMQTHRDEIVALYPDKV